MHAAHSNKRPQELDAPAAEEPVIRADLGPDERFRRVLARLVALSERGYYNPYQLFQWPERLPEEQYWMSPELMSVHGTSSGAGLTEAQFWQISKWESINFYSLNVHGIRELLLEIVGRIHTPGFELPSEYFHHVIGEENEHMWFFATFCRKYAGKIYPSKSMKFPGTPSLASGNLLVFSKLLILEEIVDFVNQAMASDDRLHPTIRQVNSVHHQDESRHIAFGRQIVAILFEQFARKASPAELSEVDLYLCRYIESSLDSFCTPAVFRDAGIRNYFKFRAAVLADPAYHELRSRISKRPTSFLGDLGVIGRNGADPHD